MSVLPRSKLLQGGGRKPARRLLRRASSFDTLRTPLAQGLAASKIVVLVVTNAEQIELAAGAIAAMAPHYGHLEKAEMVDALVSLGMQVVYRARRPRLHVDLSMPCAGAGC
jgi:hypothetical protein